MAPFRLVGGQISRWPLWTTHRWFLGVVLSTELLAVALVATGIAVVPTGVLQAAAPVGAALVIAGVLHIEITARLDELMHRRCPRRPDDLDLTSVWMFAAALLLPPTAASAVVVLLGSYRFARVARPAGTPLHQQVHRTATAVLAAHAVAVVAGVVAVDRGAAPFGGVGLLTVVAALGAYTLVTTFLAAGAAGTGRTLRDAVLR